jgi:hypothetical protein
VNTVPVVELLALEVWQLQVAHYKPLIQQVIEQTKRRVFADEKVPATEKIVSIFEEHTDIIVKGSRDIQYGHKINLSTGKSGLVLDVVIEEGNPADNAAARYTFTDEQLEDMVINNYVAQDPPSFSADKGGLFGANDFVDTRTDSSAQAGEKGAAALAAIGGGALLLKTGVASKVFNAAKGAAASSSFSSQLIDFYTNMFIAKQAAPMVQAVILMMIYMLLLIYMIMSNYDIDSTIQMIFIMLAIQFFTTIWNFADYLDAQLFISMHPDATMLGSTFNMGANRLILDIVLTLFYVVAPFLLLWIMNMAGVKVSGAANAFGSLGRAGRSTGASAGVKSMQSRMKQ